MCFSKRKRTTPTNEAKAYTLRKTYFIQYVLLKRINMKNILFVYAFLASGGSREPCHRFQRCKTEEPRPYGREPWHSVLEKILFVYMLFIIKFFFLLIPLPPAAEEKKNPTLSQRFALDGYPGTLPSLSAM